MAVSVEHVQVIEHLKRRVADDAVTIAMLQAALDQSQDVTEKESEGSATHGES